MSEAFTIQISSELISRFAEDSEKKKTRRQKPKVQKKTHQPVETHKVPAIPPPPIAVPSWPVQTYLQPPPQPANPRLEEIRSVLRESERVLEKLEKQEQDMVKQVTERAKELHDKEFKIPYQKPMPCLSEKDACLSCYKDNLKDPLKCANTVKIFEDCARRVRQQTQP